jgi:multiple sugar transport system permease protein
MRNKKLVDYAKYGYIFSIPFIVAFCVFTLYPVVYTFIIGFTNLKGAGNTEFQFLPAVGKNLFQNFIDVLKAKTFKTAFGTTCIIWIMNFIPQIGFALLFTAWFTDRRSKVKGTGLFKILFYMPNIITAATMAILFQKLFGYPIGAVNQLLGHLQPGRQPYNYLINNVPIKLIIAFVQFFQWYGHTMVNLTAGVIGISPEIFEAAEIDGANRVQTFFKITIPCIRQIMLFVLVTSLIGGLNMFDIPELLVGSKQGNGAAITTNMYIRNLAFDGSYLYNRAAAASVILFLVIVALSAVLFFVMRDKDEAKIKKLKKAELRAARKGL